MLKCLCLELLILTFSLNLLSHYFFSKWVGVGAIIFSFEGMYIRMSTKQTIIFRWGTSKWKTKQKKKRSLYKSDQQESTTWWDALVPFLSELLVEPFYPSGCKNVHVRVIQSFGLCQAMCWSSTSASSTSTIFVCTLELPNA